LGFLTEKRWRSAKKKTARSWLKTLAAPALATIYRKVDQGPSPPFDFEFPLAGKLAIEA
jgi:hypothetical protein